MKLVHLTDPHITAPGEKLRGREPIRTLRRAVRDINRFHSDALACVITGDLTHNGTKEEYENLAEALEELEIVVHKTVGNHDCRDNASAYFADMATDGNGFIQKTVETEAGVLVLMDTLDVESSNGKYCKQRLGWLEKQLADIANDSKIYLFMHHGPVQVRSPIPQLIGIADADKEALAEVLKTHNSRHGNIAHMFFGHYHRAMSGQWNGISFSSSRSLTSQRHIDQSGQRREEIRRELPQYSVAYLSADEVTIHPHEIHKSKKTK